MIRDEIQAKIRDETRFLRWVRVGVCVAGMILVLAIATAQAVQSEAASDIRRIRLDPRPEWSVSGVWSPGGETLLLVDAFRSLVIEYSTEGELRHEYQVPLKGSLDFSRPSWIRVWPRGGYIVEQEDAGFVVVDEDFQPLQEVDLRGTEQVSGFQHAAVFHWVPLSNGDLVAFGDIQTQDGSWKTGIFRVSLSASPQVTVLLEVDIEPEELDLYLVGLPYLTALDNRVYFVDLTAGPPVMREIEMREDGSNVVHRLPISTPQAGRLPLLRPYLSGNLDQLSFVYSELERSSMISGVYGWNGALYLLFHQPNGISDGSSWSLAHFDPSTGKRGGEIHLPTTAAHVTLVPGPKSWAVLEKGRVKGFGQQDIPSLLLVPSSQIPR